LVLQQTVTEGIDHLQSHTIRRPVAASITIGLALLLTAGAVAVSARQGQSNHGPKPTVVLVHGAFGDASTWTAVIHQLQKDGFPVIAPANPLRGPISDSEYTASVLDTLSGPLILVGHSYGGIVITNAAAMTHNASSVMALVYVAALIPDVGEAAQDLQATGSLIGPRTLLVRSCPVESCAAGQDAYIDPAHFREVMAGDLPEERTSVLAASQRPAALNAFSDKTEFAAWHTLPSFAIVSTEDNAVGADNERFMAQRAHAQTTEVDASHLVMISHPDTVVKIIESAASEH
jgi:pimeloyl-ACP methyl ester carboxylesterase